MPDVAKLTESELATALQDLRGWSSAGKAIERSFEFPDFTAAMVFVNRVGEVAEEHNHHPDIDIRYNRVRIASWSHDAGGVTRRDLKLAKAISEIAS